MFLKVTVQELVLLILEMKVHFDNIGNIPYYWRLASYKKFSDIEQSVITTHQLEGIVYRYIQDI